MAERSGERYPAGTTALVIPVPEAEPAVGAWRARFDSAAAAGVSEHVTVLYPFLHIDLVDAVALRALSELFGRHEAFDLEFGACGRFPDMLYLLPAPEAPLRALTRAVAERWPETPPYGGKYPDTIPHLTVAHGQGPEVYDRVEADVTPRLPVLAHVTEVLLVVSDGARWHQDTNFPLRTRPGVRGRVARG